VKPKVYFDDWNSAAVGGIGAAGTVHGWPNQPLPKREFPPGFHVAAPGPSHPEPKPRYQVKATSRKLEPAG